MTPYVYTVTQVVKVTDGDTYWLKLDVGFRQEILVNLRLLNFDCPESNRGSAFEKSEAQRARLLAERFFDTCRNVSVRTEKDPDNFGRWLGEARNIDTGELLGDLLRAEGLASIWPTRWRDEFGQGI